MVDDAFLELWGRVFFDCFFDPVENLEAFLGLELRVLLADVRFEIERSRLIVLQLGEVHLEEIELGY